MKLPPLLLALCMGAALSFSGTDLAAANDKKQDKKSSAQKVVKRDQSSPRISRASSSSGSQRMASVRQSKPEKSRSAIAQQSRTSPPRMVTTRASSRQLAPNRDRDRDRKKIAPSTQLASTSSSVTRDRDSDRRMVQRDTRVTRDDDTRRTTVAQRSGSSVRRSDSDHRDRDRDRSSYVRRHEHHSPDWYRSNGWWYDRDYWHTHRSHRYYNDILGIYIIDTAGPSYAYGSGYADGYSDYYGFDYETRLAVQEALAQAGYYNGPIDGVIGGGTRAAISRYQMDYGLAVTGQINNSLIQSLGLY